MDVGSVDLPLNSVDLNERVSSDPSRTILIRNPIQTMQEGAVLWLSLARARLKATLSLEKPIKLEDL